MFQGAIVFVGPVSGFRVQGLRAPLRASLMKLLSGPSLPPDHGVRRLLGGGENADFANLDFVCAHGIGLLQIDLRIMLVILQALHCVEKRVPTRCLLSCRKEQYLECGQPGTFLCRWLTFATFSTALP